MFKIPENYDCEGNDRSFKDFSQMMYSLQNSELFKILNIVSCKYPLNYYRADIEFKHEQITILQNCGSGHMAFAKNKKEDTYDFVDNINIQNAIYDFYPETSFLSQKLLNTTVHKNHNYLSNINENDLSYWLPCTVGEIIFSWYFD
jgi:hypothetical protein